ncbi:DMT family transporter [Rhodococcus aerolatus]
MTGTAWAVALAIAAAAAYACGVVVQQRAATAPGQEDGAGPSLAQVLLSPLWLVGVGLDAAAFGLEFLALRAGTLSLVQPLLVSGLLFALPLGAAVTGVRVTGRDARAAALVVLGLVVAVVVAAPTHGSRGAHPRAWPLTLVSVAVVVGVLLLVAVARRGPLTRTVSLASAAAIVNGVLAAFGKAVAVRSGHGWLAATLSWPALGLAVTAVLTLTLAAAAFRAGVPTAAIGILFAGEPAAGIVMGVLLHGGSLRHGPLAVPVLAAALLMCLTGVALLARSPAVLASYTAHPQHAAPQSCPVTPLVATATPAAGPARAGT